MGVLTRIFGGHDPDVPFSAGYRRRRFFDNIRQGFKISKNLSRSSKPTTGEFVRNAFANAGALGMVGALSGGWSLPAALVGAKGFINFGSGLSSISNNKRAAELLDHSLNGTLASKFGNRNLSDEGQETVRRLFGGMGIGGGDVNLGHVVGLVNNDATRDQVRTILTDALQDRWVAPDGTVEKLEQHEKNELSSLFGLAFLDHWSRDRLHPEINTVNNAAGARFQNGRASGKSFYQSFYGNRGEERAFAKTLVEPSGLEQPEKDFLFHVLEAQKDADVGTAHSFNQILSGALGMGLAGYVEGHMGNAAQLHQQQAVLQNQQAALQQQADFLSHLPEHLKVTINAKQGLVNVGNKAALGPLLRLGHGYPGLDRLFGDPGIGHFLKGVDAHLNWTDPHAVATAVQHQAAMAAVGTGISPGWAAVLGLLTSAEPRKWPKVGLPPERKGGDDDGYGTYGGGAPYENEDHAYDSMSEEDLMRHLGLTPPPQTPHPPEQPVPEEHEPYGQVEPPARQPRERLRQPAPVAGFHNQFGPFNFNMYNHAPFYYNPHLAPGVPHPMMMGPAAPVMFPGMFVHQASFGMYGGHGMGMPMPMMAPQAGFGAHMYGQMAFGHAAPVAYVPGVQAFHGAFDMSHSFNGFGFPHGGMPPIYNMFAPQFNFAPMAHWQQMQDHMHEWMGAYAEHWMKRYGQAPGEHRPGQPTPYGHAPYAHEPYEPEQGYEHFDPYEAHAYDAPAPQAETLTPHQSELPDALGQPAVRSSRKARRSVGRALDRLVEEGRFPAPEAMGHAPGATYSDMFAKNPGHIVDLQGILQHPSLSGDVYDHVPRAVSQALREAGVYGNLAPMPSRRFEPVRAAPYGAEFPHRLETVRANVGARTRALRE